MAHYCYTVRCTQLTAKKKQSPLVHPDNIIMQSNISFEVSLYPLFMKKKDRSIYKNNVDITFCNSFDIVF